MFLPLPDARLYLFVFSSCHVALPGAGVVVTLIVGAQCDGSMLVVPSLAMGTMDAWRWLWEVRISSSFECNFGQTSALVVQLRQRDWPSVNPLKGLLSPIWLHAVMVSVFEALAQVLEVALSKQLLGIKRTLQDWFSSIFALPLFWQSCKSLVLRL